MDFHTLSKLTDSQVLEGIATYYNNGADKLESSQILAEQKKYGSAIALAIISIEEFIKAYGCYCFYMKVEESSVIDAAFKPIIDVKSLHKSRLKYALGLNTTHNNIDTNELTGRLESLINSKKLIPENEPENLEALLSSIDNIVDQLFPEIIKTKKLMLENLDSKIDEAMEDSSSWFLHAQAIKEKGIYADNINGIWHSPIAMDEEQYKVAYNHAKGSMENFCKNIPALINADEINRICQVHLTRRFLKKWLAYT